MSVKVEDIIVRNENVPATKATPRVTASTESTNRTR